LPEIYKAICFESQKSHCGYETLPISKDGKICADVAEQTEKNLNEAINDLYKKEYTRKTIQEKKE
tara:strand:+ start:138 stop:332 length:195 start_codon:yes stop_codon:yes gene_type:complete